MIPVSAEFAAAARAATRKPRARATITWSDPVIDTTITTSANSENRISYRSNVYDFVETVPHKWFHLDGATPLSGLMHPAPSTESESETYQMGWWSAARCDASAVFSTPPALTMNFAVRAVVSLLVVGDDSWNEYPVDFTIQIYNGASLVYTETVTANDAVKWEKDIYSEGITEATKMILTITKWSAANRVAKILQFYTLVKRVYDGDDIVSLRLLEEMDYTNGSLPIGNISANEIDLELQNIDDDYFPGNTLSVYHTFLKVGRKIEVELGFVLPDLSTEYVALGTFFSSDWQAQELGTTASTSARDRLELLRKTTFSTSVLYANKTLYELAETVLEDAKLSMIDLEWNIDSELQDYIIPYAWFPKKSHRDTIRDIVEACMGYAYMDRYDVLQIGLPWNIVAAGGLAEMDAGVYEAEDEIITF